MADRVDFKQKFKPYYSPKPGKPEFISPPSMQVLMVDGRGDPNVSGEFQDAIQALYKVIYGLKFSRKKQGKTPDFSVGALEGLWWNEHVKPFEMGQKKDWSWTLLVWLPDFIKETDVKEVVEQAKAKKPNPKLDELRLETFYEGQCVQIMHVGPYDTEQSSLDLMLKFMAEYKLIQNGKHHEIYLGDPRRADPSKLRTIIRHPVKKQ